MNTRVLAYFLVATTLLPFLYACKSTKIIIDPKPPVLIEKLMLDSIRNDSSYRPNQIIVVFNAPPTPLQIQRIKDRYNHGKPTPDPVTIRSCDSCGGLVQLWTAAGIHSHIIAEGISAGTTGNSHGVGEDSLASYSLNYISSIPTDLTFRRDSFNNINIDKSNFAGVRKDTVVIAVLDTGIDTLKFVDKKYLWRNRSEMRNTIDDDQNCYKDDISGWNFVQSDPAIYDDNVNIHGTLVSQYIINQFKISANFVQIMVLKTHDSNGQGELFNAICAIHYAIKKKANILNASWGYYNYQITFPYLDRLITDSLPKHDILFFAAAGNHETANDMRANELYRSTHHNASIPDLRILRNLSVNSFYPACLSTAGNSAFTVTTTDGTTVSSSQNYSDQYVDIGVMRDSSGVGNTMFFRQPFNVSLPRGVNAYIKGSSFATPIALGKLAARLPVAFYSIGISKARVFLNPLVMPILSVSAPLINSGLIRMGKYSR